MMEYRLLTDKNDAKIVLCHPAIYQTISSDYAPPIEMYEPGEGIYFGGYVGGDLVAVMVFHYKTATVAQCHIQVLPDYRKDYAHDFAKTAINWWSITHGIKLYAEIPEIYPNVIYFALKHKFKIDGRSSKVFKKNGKLVDVYYLSREASYELGG